MGADEHPAPHNPRDLAHELRTALTVASVGLQLARRRLRAGQADPARPGADLDLPLDGVAAALRRLERAIEVLERGAPSPPGEP